MNSTHEENVISNKKEITSLGSCSHEEANSRSFVHLKNIVYGKVCTGASGILCTFRIRYCLIFFGKRNKTFFQRWQAIREVSEALNYIPYPQEEIPDHIFLLIERFIVQCYSPTLKDQTVNSEKNFVYK